MGCIGSKVDPQEKDAAQQNARIDRQLRSDRKQQSRTVKILLLGMLTLSAHPDPTQIGPLTNPPQVPVNRVNLPLSNRCESSTPVDSRTMNESRSRL